YVTQFLNSAESLGHCERRATGATRPRIARRELAALPFVVPPEHLLRAFREVAKPIQEQRANLFLQTGSIRVARDLLLPRLMSGEIPREGARMMLEGIQPRRSAVTT